MSDCPHGLPLASCGECLMDGPPPPLKARPAVYGEFGFEAQFPGRCADCDDEIEAGARIARMSDGTYWHDGCVTRWAHR